MGKYEIAVFDVDGTLLDTTEGVLASVKYTIDKMGFEPLSEDVLKTFIGPPIQDSFAKAYNLSGDILQDIATCFRNRYKDYELLKAVPYDGTAGETLITSLSSAIADMEGAAKDAFKTLIDGDINNFVATDLPGAIEGMASLLEANRDNFEKVDQQIADNISGG